MYGNTSVLPYRDFISGLCQASCIWASAETWEPLSGPPQSHRVSENLTTPPRRPPRSLMARSTRGGQAASARSHGNAWEVPPQELRGRGFRAPTSNEELRCRFCHDAVRGGAG